MTENFGNIKGYFKIECIKNGKVIDSFEDHNLIMETARHTMAELIAGISGTPIINKFVIGNKGHIGAKGSGRDDGDILLPKTSENGFIYTRNQLFSEEFGKPGIDYFQLEFKNSGTSGDIVKCTDGKSSVRCTLEDNKNVVYEINISEDSCNSKETIIFTEAALYAGSKIFSARCFKAKVKDNTTSLRITWKILF